MVYMKNYFCITRHPLTFIFYAQKTAQNQNGNALSIVALFPKVSSSWSEQLLSYRLEID